LTLGFDSFVTAMLMTIVIHYPRSPVTGEIAKPRASTRW
jgi:hypothetical protein